MAVSKKPQRKVDLATSIFVSGGKEALAVKDRYDSATAGIVVNKTAPAIKEIITSAAGNLSLTNVPDLSLPTINGLTSDGALDINYENLLSRAATVSQGLRGILNNRNNPTGIVAEIARAIPGASDILTQVDGVISNSPLAKVSDINNVWSAIEVLVGGRSPNTIFTQDIAAQIGVISGIIFEACGEGIANVGKLLIDEAISWGYTIEAISGICYNTSDSLVSISDIWSLNAYNDYLGAGALGSANPNTIMDLAKQFTIPYKYQENQLPALYMDLIKTLYGIDPMWDKAIRTRDDGTSITVPRAQMFYDASDDFKKVWQVGTATFRDYHAPEKFRSLSLIDIPAFNDVLEENYPIVNVFSV